MKFLRNLLATLVGLFIFTFIIGFVFFVFIAMVSSTQGDKVTEIKDNSVLHLKLNKQILEREVENPLEGLPIFAGMEEGGIGLMEFKEALHHAAEDDHVKGILLESPAMMSGISTLDELRDALSEFKKSGKFIYSYSEMYTEGAYYLASVADSVFMNPDFAMLEFNGLNIESMYFKGLFDKLDIEPITFRVGEYKEIAEPFTRKNMSPAVKVRYKVLLSKIYGNLTKKIAADRQLTNDEVMHISDSALVNLETDAVKYGLVDELAYRDEVNSLIKKRIGIEEDADINFVSYSRYRKSYDSYKSSKNRIAVIIASGNIVMGKGDNNNIGSDKYAKEIRKAADNDAIKAIVLRINSGGGSALASDVMWREIRRATTKKPVIASMSDYAASGGYFMAMGCDTILAQPNTITGSIGVFSMIFNIQDFLGDKLGVTTDGVKTGKFSDLYSMTRPLTDYEKQYIQKSTDNAYLSFITKAAAGRHMDIEKIKAIAAGRIWTGEEALENGLVDMIGDLDDAIDIAAQKAGVNDDFRIRVYPVQKPPYEELLESLTGETETSVLAKKLDKFYPYLQGIESIKNLQGLQAREFVKVSF